VKIWFETYNPFWQQAFELIKAELTAALGFATPEIEHIGSTSVTGLSAKPIIDVLVGLASDKQLDMVVEPLMDKGYVYYQKYNDEMPYRRFFVKHKVTAASLSIPLLIGKDTKTPDTTLEHEKRLAHIHVLRAGSEHWTRHIAFRDYLRTHPRVREEYQRLKELLSTREWKDGNEYNDGKNDFIKREEQKAIEWYERV
jgi:GrpB-like predicted nucleotidyltransferase (UPF0157 family)